MWGEKCNDKSDSSKRLLWNEKLKETSSFKISDRDLDSVPVVSTVRLGIPQSISNGCTLVFTMVVAFPLSNGF